MGELQQRPPSDEWGVATRWTLVRRAARTDGGPDAERAWRELIDRYRGPVLAAVRRRLPHGFDAEDVAADLFAYLYEHRVLERADPDSGRFRCYMQGVIRRFVLHYVRANAPSPLPIPDDFDVAERAREVGAAEIEEAEWASAFLTAALARLRARRPRDAQILADYYGIGGDRVDGAELRQRLRLGADAFHVALHRARRRLRDELEREVLDTAATQGEAAVEMGVITSRLLEAHAGLLGGGDEA